MHIPSPSSKPAAHTFKSLSHSSPLYSVVRCSSDCDTPAKDSCDYIGPTQMIQDNLLVLRYVTITFAKSFWPFNVTCSWFLWTRMWTSFGEASLFYLPRDSRWHWTMVLSMLTQSDPSETMPRLNFTGFGGTLTFFSCLMVRMGFNRSHRILRGYLVPARSNALFWWDSGKCSWIEKEEGLMHWRRGLAPRLLSRNTPFSETKVIQKNSMAMG